MTEIAFTSCSDCEHRVLCWYLGKYENHCVYYKKMKTTEEAWYVA